MLRASFSGPATILFGAGISGCWCVAPTVVLSGAMGQEWSKNSPMARWRARSFDLNLTSFGRSFTSPDDQKRPMTVKPFGLVAHMQELPQPTLDKLSIIGT